MKPPRDRQTRQPQARSGRPRAHRSPGFTLIELVVTIGIIILLVAIAVPALGPALASGHRTQAIAALNSSMVAAQTSALSNTTEVALRIERAVELDNYGQMPDRTKPKFLDHQQIRYVIFNKGASLSQPAFQYIPDSKITALPSTMWFAPTNFTGSANTSGYGPGDPFQATTSSTPPTLIDPYSTGVAPYYPFDTFYIVFSSNGMLKQWRTKDTPLQYADETQKTGDSPPIIVHPQDSATGVLLYERKKLENAPNNITGLFEFLRSSGQALYINRFLGTTVESQ